MANYATYQDVEKAYYGLTGNTFDAAQQAIVTALLTTAHGDIVNLLGAEQTDANSTLLSIEVDIVCNQLRNAENRGIRDQWGRVMGGVKITEDIKERILRAKDESLTVVRKPRQD